MHPMHRFCVAIHSSVFIFTPKNLYSSESRGQDLSFFTPGCIGLKTASKVMSCQSRKIFFLFNEIFSLCIRCIGNLFEPMGGEIVLYWMIGVYFYEVEKGHEGLDLFLANQTTRSQLNGRQNLVEMRAEPPGEDQTHMVTTRWWPLWNLLRGGHNQVKANKTRGWLLDTIQTTIIHTQLCQSHALN